MNRFILGILTTTILIASCEKQERFDSNNYDARVNEYGINIDSLPHSIYTKDSSKIFFYGILNEKVKIVGFSVSTKDNILNYTDIDNVDFEEELIFAGDYFIENNYDTIAKRTVDNIRLHSVDYDNNLILSVYYSLEFRGDDGASYHPYLDKLLFFENGSLVKHINKWEDNFFFWMIPWFEQSVLITGGSKHTCFSNSGDSIFSVVKIRDPFGMYVEPINQNECLTARYLAGLCRVFASGEISWVLPYSLIIGSEELYPAYYDFKVLNKNNNVWSMQHDYLDTNGIWQRDYFQLNIDEGKLIDN